MPSEETKHAGYSKQFLSGDVCFLWIGQNLLNVSVYAGDAVAMQLDLLGGDGVIHDWNYLLSELGILNYTHAVATTIWSLGFLTIASGTILALFHAWSNKEVRSLPLSV